MTSAGFVSDRGKQKLEKECVLVAASTAIMRCKHLLLFELFVGHD